MKHLNKKLFKEKSFDFPVVLLMHLNSGIYNINGIKNLSHIVNKMNALNLNNFQVLPILTNSQSILDNRIDQVNEGLKRIYNANDNKKLHILCYSMASLPLHGFIHEFDGSKFIESVLFLSSPNQ
jgi:hypothetical protein